MKSLRVAALTAAMMAPTALAQPLPPNHPPVPERSSAPLPPNHPPVPGRSPAPLPPNHPPIPAPPSSAALMEQLDKAKGLEAKDKTFEVASAMGKLYFSQGRYADALKVLGEAETKAAGATKLLLSARRAAPSSAMASPGPECAPSDAALDAKVEVARKLLAAGRAAQAVGCAQVASKAWVEVVETQARAHALRGDVPAAAFAYARILEVEPDSPVGLYGQGAALLDSKSEDVAALRQVKLRWERYLAVAPQGPRAASIQRILPRVELAITEGGMQRLSAKEAAAAKASASRVVESLPAAPKAPAGTGQGVANPPQLTQEMVDAVQNTERTPELQQGLAKLVEEGEEHLARGRYQEALDAYKRVVPFQPENGRAKAGMAWSLVGLDRQPMAERIWTVAVSADAAAVDRLGEVLAAKGDAQGAKKLWTKLAQSAPAYASKLQAKLR